MWMASSFMRISYQLKFSVVLSAYLEPVLILKRGLFWVIIYHMTPVHNMLLSGRDSKGCTQTRSKVFQESYPILP